MAREKRESGAKARRESREPTAKKRVRSTTWRAEVAERYLLRMAWKEYIEEAKRTRERAQARGANQYVMYDPSMPAETVIQGMALELMSMVQ